MAFDDWLVEATPADLVSLAEGIGSGRIALPAALGALQLAGFDVRAAAFLQGLGATEPSVVAWLLRRLAEERRRGR